MPTPALFTTTSTRPGRLLHVRGGGDHGVAVGHVDGVGVARSTVGQAQRGGGPGGLAVDVEAEHLGAVGGERGGRGPPDATAGAGDDHDGVGQGDGSAGHGRPPAVTGAGRAAPRSS